MIDEINMIDTPHICDKKIIQYSLLSDRVVFELGWDSRI